MLVERALAPLAGATQALEPLSQRFSGTHELALPFGWSFVALTGLAGVLLACATIGHRQWRSRNERIVAARRRRYRHALARDSREVTRAVREALRSRAAAVDFVRALEAAEADGHAVSREALVDAAARAGASPVLGRRLSSRRAAVRGHAALLVARLGLPDSCQLLEGLIADGDPDVAHTALEGVACQRNQAAVATLLDALAGGWLAPERVVEYLGARWALDGLLLALEDPGRASTRAWVIEALGLARERRAAGALCAVLARPASPEEHAKAARALGRVGDPAAVEALVDALGHEQWAVRAQAARALERIPDAGAADALRGCLCDRAWWVRVNAAEALRALGPAGECMLRDALDDPDRYARERAAEALSMLAVPAGAP